VARLFKLPNTLDVGGSMKATNKMRMPIAEIAERVYITVRNLVPFYVVAHAILHITLGRPLEHHRFSMEQITATDRTVNLILWNRDRTKRM
jgi:hypothetical protein